MVLFQQEGSIYQVPHDQWQPLYDQFAEQCRAEHDEVVAMGGLHILGTERHEARRIDNQLRGRAGRQGDPGSSRFFLSLEDDLLRIFGGERVKALMYRLGMTEGVPIESRLISKRIENAQKAVEAQNFEARKHLLEYDDVMNKQRETMQAPVYRAPQFQSPAADAPRRHAQFHHEPVPPARFHIASSRIQRDCRDRRPSDARREIHSPCEASAGRL